MATVCPKCCATLRVASISEAAFCLGCNSITAAGPDGLRWSRYALKALFCGGLSAIPFGMGFRNGGNQMLWWLLCLFLGSAAISNGIRAIDDIRLPHYRQQGLMIAWIGFALGVITFFAPIGLFAFFSTVGMEHILDGNSVSVHAKGWSQRPENSVLGNLQALTADFERRKADDGYVSLLDNNGIKWRMYHPIMTDPKDLDPDFHSTFFERDFDDSEWTEITDDGSGVGYGDDSYGVQMRRPTNRADRRTAYFRTRFNTEIPLKKIAIQLSMDDGAMIYVNGIRARMVNLPKGAAEGYYVMAPRAISGADENGIMTFELQADLQPGRHLLAISLHNARNSSDLGLRNVAVYGSAQPFVPKPALFADPMPELPADAGYEVVFDSTMAPWRFLHPIGTDRELDLGFQSRFAEVHFDDSAWLEVLDREGRGVGYGETDEREYGFDLETPRRGDRYTAYFRSRFTTSIELNSLVIEFRCDDGVIVYIDGDEVTRWNMSPKAEDLYKTLAAQAVTTDARRQHEDVVVRQIVEVERLPPGPHVLALSVHNATTTSSDLGIRQVKLFGAPNREASSPNE